MEVRERKASIYQSEAMIGTVITNVNNDHQLEVRERKASNFFLSERSDGCSASVKRVIITERRVVMQLRTIRWP